MIKADLVDKIVERTQYAQKDVAITINNLFTAIKAGMAEGNNIEIRGFGTYKVKLRKGRPARNPRTVETIQFPDRKLPVFKPSKEFIELVMKSKTNRV